MRTPPGQKQRWGLVLGVLFPYWFSGLNVSTPASVFEQAPSGSTRKTESFSAQNARIPVWLTVIGTARTVRRSFLKARVPAKQESLSDERFDQ